MKTGVIGLGLIGGSIFKDLKRLGYDVVGISQSQSGENIYKDYSALTDCDVVFVCTPMSKTVETLDRLETVINQQTVVTDVCSLKRFLCQKERPYNFIPAHPMAGTEKQGYENSFEGLFKGAKWVITPYRTDKKIPEALLKIINELGATPVVTTPQEHDEAVALISHMPMVVAQGIFQAASTNKLALEIAASGFRDMTRLAMSNTEMANDMVTMNSDNIEKSLLMLYKSIGDLTCENYLDKIKDIKSNRQKMFL